MTEDNLKRADYVFSQISFLRNKIKELEVTQSDEYKPRNIFISFTGTKPYYTIKPNLCKPIVKLILDSYNEELTELEKEFQSL